MKNFISICTFILFFSCQKNKDIGFQEPNEICAHIDSITPPLAFDLKEMSVFNNTMGFKEYQFITEKVGYILCSKIAGGYVGVLKTEDKGLTWRDLNINTPRFPVNMRFKNEKEGFITFHDVTGCPTNCQTKASLLKTKDGGLSWEEMIYPNLKGILYHLKFDNDGNVFAMLSDNGNYSLLKSTDNCTTWALLFSSPEVGFTSIRFSYTLHHDKLYLSGKNGKIIKIDKNGQLIASLTTGQTNIYDLKIFNENTLIAEGRTALIKSNDGGITWKSISEEDAQIIDFSSENDGIILLNKRYCQTDVYQANDVIAYTQDGGLTWQEGKESTNLVINYKNGQIDANGKYQFLIGRKFIELVKK